jgi:protein TonB
MLLFDSFLGSVRNFKRDHQAGSVTWWKKPILIALAISLLTHGIFLVIKFNRQSEAEKRLKVPISVVLLNSHGHTPPVKAHRLAQADLNGGGSSNADASALKQADQGVAQKLESLQKEQTRLLSSLKDKHNNAATTVVGKSQSAKTEVDPLEAELTNRIIREGRAPRKAILTATSAKSVVYAQYYDAMRRKVENYGTKYFPRSGSTPLYGSLVILVSVNSKGRIITKPVVKKSSGNAELDRQAIAIVNACEPFGYFPPTMANQLDIIDWVTTFDFVRGGDAPTKLELRDTQQK